jgi:hypothetical protein
MAPFDSATLVSFSSPFTEMTISSSDLLASPVPAPLAGCLSLLALFWSGYCFFLGGPEGHVGSESRLVAAIALGVAIAFAYVTLSFLRSADTHGIWL